MVGDAKIQATSPAVTLQESHVEPTPASSSETGKPTLPRTELEKGIVGWDGQDDPSMPLNFSKGRKWGLLGQISAITFLSPFASSIFAPGAVFMDEEFHNTDGFLSSFVVSVYILGSLSSFNYCP